MIGIINYNGGNPKSVFNAFRMLKVEAQIISDPRSLKYCNGVVLPGVGSADRTMESLQSLGFIDELSELVLARSLPYLGICVGMQILFNHSQEAGGTECLGWLNGTVERLPDDKVRVPQMGWNSVKSFSGDYLPGASSSEIICYFVNSYVCKCVDDDQVVGTTDYGLRFTSMARKNNIQGVQFHAEKSGRDGLRVLREFAGLAEGGKECSAIV